MAHLDYVDPETAPSDTTSLLAADEEQYGRPSLFARAMANHPALLAARHRYTRAVVQEGGLDPELVELITVAVSATNDCAYCVASHTEQLIEGLDVSRERARAVAAGDYSDLGEPDRAAVRIAEQIARNPAGVGAEGIESLRSAGFDDAAIVAVVTTCAMAVSANVIADALGIDPADRTAPFTGYSSNA